MKDWISCNGQGIEGSPALPSRRQILRGATAAALAAWVGQSALSNAAFGDTKDAAPRDVLVTLFLRGGADGLSLLVPHGEDAYYRIRPTLALAKPSDGRSSVGNRALDLNGFFGLHPSLNALLPLYKEGTLAALHAVGSGDATRSHFEAMATMERGMTNDKATVTSGWLARHLAAVPALTPSPLRAVAFGNIQPDALRGATDASTVSSLDDFRLDIPTPFAKSNLASTIHSLYHAGDDAVALAGQETLAVLDALRRIDPSHYQPENGAKYPTSDLGNGLRQVACLVKARIGLEIACLDRGGWDTHVAQGTANGYLALQLKDVGDSLAAFLADLGPTGRERVTVLVMTEFGRRAYENSGLGTDHGRASAMFVLGGGVNGGRVYSHWPGLEPHQLEDPGDLRVTTDYRAVLAEVVARRLGGASAVSTIFPGIHTSDFPGVVRPRTGTG